MFYFDLIIIFDIIKYIKELGMAQYTIEIDYEALKAFPGVKPVFQSCMQNIVSLFHNVNIINKMIY